MQFNHVLFGLLAMLSLCAGGPIPSRQTKMKALYGPGVSFEIHNEPVEVLRARSTDRPISKEAMGVGRPGDSIRMPSIDPSSDFHITTENRNGGSVPVSTPNMEHSDRSQKEQVDISRAETHPRLQPRKLEKVKYVACKIILGFWGNLMCKAPHNYQMPKGSKPQLFGQLDPETGDVMTPTSGPWNGGSSTKVRRCSTAESKDMEPSFDQLVQDVADAEDEMRPGKPIPITTMMTKRHDHPYGRLFKCIFSLGFNCRLKKGDKWYDLDDPNTWGAVQAHEPGEWQVMKAKAWKNNSRKYDDMVAWEKDQAAH